MHTRIQNLDSAAILQPECRSTSETHLSSSLERHVITSASTARGVAGQEPRFRTNNTQDCRGSLPEDALPTAQSDLREDNRGVPTQGKWEIQAHWSPLS